MGPKGSAVVATLLITVGFGCSGNATQPSSATSTILSPTACRSVTFSAPTLSNRAEGGPTGVYFNGHPSGGASSCTQLLPVSNSSFVTVGPVSNNEASGSQASLWAFRADMVVAPNSAATSRAGTVSFNDATLVVYQDRSQLAITLSMLDPARTSAPTTECDLRGSTGQPTTCTVVATVTANGGAPIASYDWTVYYFYNNTLNFVYQTGPSPQISLVDSCGKLSSTPEGAAILVRFELVVTDSGGNAMTLRTENNQPLYIRAFTCGS